MHQIIFPTSAELKNLTINLLFQNTPEIKLKLSISMTLVNVEGELFREVVESMQRKAEGTLSPDRHLLYYSGHDMSIVDMQVMLGVLREDLRLIVRPASALLLELHQEPQTDKHYLQVGSVHQSTC